MKKYTYYLLQGFLVMCLIVLTVTVALASPGAPPATPVDGGLSLLLAAGGIYGIKKVRDHRRAGK